MGDASTKEMKSRRDNDASDDPVAVRVQQLWDMARPRYDAIMARHIQLPVEHGSNISSGSKDVDLTSKSKVDLESKVVKSQFSTNSPVDFESKVDSESKAVKSHFSKGITMGIRLPVRAGTTCCKSCFALKKLAFRESM
jgi:hypothetical protein